jgi:putative intracellular protease/amidase
MAPKKILMIVTSHSTLGETGTPTGLWFEEVATPYLEFTRAGAEVDIASPLGGEAPIDPRSVKEPHPAVERFKQDPAAMKKLKNTLPIDAVQARYDAVFLAGGHGVMWDLPSSQALGALLSHQYGEGRLVAAVCHGPAGLVGARKANGEPLVAGHRVAGFSNEEERAIELDRVMPFLLETRLSELGARYERGAMWSAFVVRDGHLITGQNPASAGPVAREVLAVLGAATAG